MVFQNLHRIGPTSYGRAEARLGRSLAPVCDVAKTEFGDADIQDAIRLLEAVHLRVGSPTNWKEWAGLTDAAGLDPLDLLGAVFATRD